VIAVDSSILAPAINRWSPHHARAAELLEMLANGDRPWAIPLPSVHGLLALVTHRHGVARPLPATEAVAFVRQLLGSPSVTVLSPGARHVEMLAELIGESDRISARLMLAATLREHGVRELLSADTHMRSFSFLVVTDPLRVTDWSPASPPERRYRRLRARPPRSRG
jgi:predicted nucleic acid-binding protein